jgi:hypothetical protein
MAAGQGFKTFVTGDVLTAADTNGYLMQGVWVFASAAARDAAVTSPQEGNTCYLKDTDNIMVYSGSAWVTKSASGGASGLTLIKTVNYTTASTTSTDFNSQFTSTYKFYMIEIKCTHSAGAANLNMQFSNGATTKATNYYGAFGDFSGTAWSGAATSNGTSCKINYVHTTQNFNNIFVTGVGSAQKPVFNGSGYAGQLGNPIFYGYQIDETATNYDGFVISPASGTITGTVSLYGLAAS